MIITIAKDAGYCFGVRDAVQTAYEAAEKYGKVYMLGDIVHNERVVKDLAEVGAVVVETLEDIPAGSPVLLRAHGTTVELWEEVKNRDLTVIDATCPLVREIHDEVRALQDEGAQIIIIGDHGHDEVVAIASQVDNPIILSTADEAREIRKMKRAAVVSQSTQKIENVQAIINVLMDMVYSLKFVNTICFPTKRNHEQIKSLAENNDVMIVIGSFTSANSKRLTQIAQERNPNSYQVTQSGDVKSERFAGAKTVGISAGASTPDYLIESVRKRIESIAEHAEVSTD